MFAFHIWNETITTSPPNITSLRTVDTGDDMGEFVAPLQVDETEIDVSAPEMELQPMGDQDDVEVEQHEVSVEISIEEDVSEIDVEGTPPGDIPAPHRETSADDEPVAEPMDLVTPLDTDIECQFEVQEEEMPPGEDSKVKEDGKDAEEGGFKVEVETDNTLEKVDKESLIDEEVKEKKEEEEEAEGSEDKKAIERLDSVLSFQPDAEELLYEGDVENELESKQEKEEHGKKEEFTLDEGKEDGFIVDLHGDSMEIDEGPKEAEKKRSEMPGKKTGGEARRKTPAAEVSRFVVFFPQLLYVQVFSPQVHTYNTAHTHTHTCLLAKTVATYPTYDVETFVLRMLCTLA